MDNWDSDFLDLAEEAHLTSFRGRDRVAWAFTFAVAAYNLVRLPKLIAEAG